MSAPARVAHPSVRGVGDPGVTEPAGESVVPDGRHGPDPAVLLQGLSESQRHAVRSPESPLCVLAAAGSGKTTVLTRRVAHRVLEGSAQAERTLVVTFTRKAAAQLRSRLARLGLPGAVRAGTFHALAYEQLRRHWADRDVRPCALVEDPTPIVAAILGDQERRAVVARAALGEIHWAQVRMLAPDDYPGAARRAGRNPRAGLSGDDLAGVYRRYQHEKDKRGVLDLDDLVTRCATLLEEDGAAAAASRWRTRHLFVDEFQDVNPAQWRLLSAWLGDSRDLFVVGDPHQAIYAWNGADPSLLDTLPTLVPGITVVRLDDNHRCTPQVVATAATVLEGAAARATRPDGPAPVVEGFDDDGAEALAVARWLRCAHRPGRSWSQLAVLARTHARLEPVAAALGAAGIPVRLAGARSDAELRASVGKLRRMPAQRRLRSALAELVASDDSGSERPAIDALVRLADEHALESPGASVSEFVEWVVAEGVLDHEAETGDAVELCTFHRAKGLEWPAVAVVGLEAGMVPIVHATAPEAVAEEHRLLYVALTRAEDELWCSWSALRQAGTKTWRCEPSPLVERLSRVARHGAGPRPDLTARFAALRAMLPATDTRLPAAG